LPGANSSPVARKPTIGKLLLVLSIRNVRNAYKILVRTREGKRSLGRLRCRDNIKMGLKEIVCEGVNWINLLHAH
jgi:hypothetical protein